jgi:hypothetical protein
MYLMILESGAKWKSAYFSEEDKKAADDGVLEVIDISRPENPMEYYDDGWHEIDVFGA